MAASCTHYRFQDDGPTPNAQVNGGASPVWAEAINTPLERSTTELFIIRWLLQGDGVATTLTAGGKSPTSMDIEFSEVGSGGNGPWTVPDAATTAVISVASQDDFLGITNEQLGVGTGTYDADLISAYCSGSGGTIIATGQTLAANHFVEPVWSGALNPSAITPGTQSIEFRFPAIGSDDITNSVFATINLGKRRIYIT